MQVANSLELIIFNPVQQHYQLANHQKNILIKIRKIDSKFICGFKIKNFLFKFDLSRTPHSLAYFPDFNFEDLVKMSISALRESKHLFKDEDTISPLRLNFSRANTLGLLFALSN